MKAPILRLVTQFGGIFINDQIMANYFVRKKILDIVKNIDLCLYCGSNNKLTIDHIVPQNKGGNGELCNLTRACSRCNCYKSDFTIDIFKERIIQKRKISYSDFTKYSNRYRNTLKRHKIKDENLLIKIRKSIEDFKYFTRVLDSINNNKYIING